MYLSLELPLLRLVQLHVPFFSLLLALVLHEVDPLLPTLLCHLLDHGLIQLVYECGVLHQHRVCVCEYLLQFVVPVQDLSPHCVVQFRLPLFELLPQLLDLLLNDVVLLRERLLDLPLRQLIILHRLVYPLQLPLDLPVQLVVGLCPLNRLFVFLHRLQLPRIAFRLQHTLQRYVQTQSPPQITQFLLAVPLEQVDLVLQVHVLLRHLLHYLLLISTHFTLILCLLHGLQFHAVHKPQSVEHLHIFGFIRPQTAQEGSIHLHTPVYLQQCLDHSGQF